MGAASVVVVGEYPTSRLGVCITLKRARELEVVGEAKNLKAALRVVKSVEPDVVVQDMQIEDASDEHLCRCLKMLPCSPRVVFHTYCNPQQDIYRCFTSGADGFVHKCEEPERLVDAVRQVAHGKRIWLLGEEPATGDVSEGEDTVDDADLASLTAKEQEVLKLLLEGHPNRHIAQLLCVSLPTVKTHVYRIYGKLGISSRGELFAAHGGPYMR